MSQNLLRNMRVHVTNNSKCYKKYEIANNIAPEYENFICFKKLYFHGKCIRYKMCKCTMSKYIIYYCTSYIDDLSSILRQHLIGDWLIH